MIPASARVAVARALRWLHRTEDALLALAALALIVLAALQIALRNLGGPSLPWMDPLLRSLVLWLGLLGALVATRERRHIRIDLLPRLLPPRWAKACERLAAALAALVCALLAWQAVRLVADERSFGAIAFLGIPVWVLQLVLPLSFGLMALRMALQAASASPDPSDRSASTGP